MHEGPLGTSDTPADHTVDVERGAHPGSWIVTIAAPAVPGSLARLSGALTLCDLDIRWAAVRLMGDGTVRDSFEVAAMRPGADADGIRECVVRTIARVASGGLDLERTLRDRCPPRCPRDHVTVELDLDSAITTGVRLRAPDRPGLLHDAALTISMNGFRVRSITVLTVGGVARDTFRIVDGDGRAPAGDARLRVLVAELAERCR